MKKTKFENWCDRIEFPWWSFGNPSLDPTKHRDIRELLEKAHALGKNINETNVTINPDNRLSFPEYAMALARVSAMRSEDPYRKVGAVAFDKDNRVIGTAYNGLPSGFTAPEGFWTDRERRRKYMIHAEVNLCSLFKRGDAKMIAVTTMPCNSCMGTIAAYGIEKIYYGEDYHMSGKSCRVSESPEIAELFGIELIKL